MPALTKAPPATHHLETPEGVTALYLSGDSAEVRRLRRRAFALALFNPKLLAEAEKNELVFVALIDDAISVFEVRQARLAERLNASPAQIGRWRDRKAAPPSYARRGILWHVGAMILEDLGDTAVPAMIFGSPDDDAFADHEAERLVDEEVLDPAELEGAN